MNDQNTVSWNNLITCYQQNGLASEALEVFVLMMKCGFKPDELTLVSMAGSCTRIEARISFKVGEEPDIFVRNSLIDIYMKCGSVEDGCRVFINMLEGDYVSWNAMIMGQAGCLNDAKNLIEDMPIEPNAVIWGSLLAACKVHRNITLGEYVAEKLLDIEPKNSILYVLLSNMYAELGIWADVVRVRKLMRQRGVIKQPSCRWIETQGHVHVFLVKDKRHPQRKEIHYVLKLLLEQMRRSGYVEDACDLESNEEHGESQLTSLYHIDMLEDATVG
ncbi:hypothetical protein EV1_028199 [Malus domestica]